MPLVLFNPYIGPYQALPLRARVDLGAIAIKGYSAFPKAPASLEPHNQTAVISRTLVGGGGLTTLQRCSQCILQPQPTGQEFYFETFFNNLFRGSLNTCI